MHHVVIDRWAQLDSVFHRREPRVKIVALLAFLVCLATAPPHSFAVALAFAAILAICVLGARLPLLALLLRAGVVLPFSASFAVLLFLSGHHERAIALIIKSYVSALAVLLLAATTPLPALMQGLEGLGCPRILVVVVQFVYRYLFVISDEAERMQLAARSRASKGAWTFHSAAGALAVLFGRSFRRAQGVHHAMIARGFNGHIPSLIRRPAGAGDLAFLTVAVSIPVLVRLGASRFAA